MPEKKCSYEGCGRDVYRGGDKCIFHCEEKDPQEFRNELARQIRQWRNKGAGEWNFREWVFVDRQWEPNLFGRAVFPVNTVFGGAKFQTLACFVSARFKGFAFFNLAQFTKHASFGAAQFTGDVNLYHASFAVSANLTNVTTTGLVRLIWRGEEIKAGRLLLKSLCFKSSPDGAQPLLDLRNNELREDRKLIIKNTDLSRVLLTRTDCRQIEFYNIPKWAEWKGRRAVADEVFLRNDPTRFGKKSSDKEEFDTPSWDEIAITYQQLVANFRKELDHPLANDFERGLFEARLMAAKEKGDWKNEWLLGFYKCASDFSGSIWRPAYRLLSVILVCAIIYAGLLYGRELAWSASGIGNVIFKGLIAALRVASLDRGWFSNEVDWTLVNNVPFRFVLTLVALLQTLFTAALVTLFIFSVRRRFKHSE
ncbi:pentapeptide repeat-containing protein [bacterium]|nr:pentapeptide repeat-containing protein [bacterium]MBU1983889.1 pentapeptide repeat-containing protein [bacterium]